MKSAVSRPAASHVPTPPSQAQAIDAFGNAPPMTAQRQAIAAIHASPRVVAQRNAIGRLRGDVAQREPVPYTTSYAGGLTAHKPKVASVVGELDARVQAAHEQALNWRTLEAHPDAMVRQWHQGARAYAENPEMEPAMLYARFGYAIESLACQGLNNTRMHGMDMQIQVSHGHTRPDVVASVTGEEVLWLDITSEASTGHILGKDSSSWARRPFVFEICYPQLSLRALLDATDDPYYKELGGFLADEKQIEGDVKEARGKSLRDSFIKLRDTSGWRAGFGDAAEKRRVTRDMFMASAADEGVEEETASMANTKGALENLGVNPGAFGFNRGEVKSKTQRLNEVVDASASEEIGGRKAGLAAAASVRLIKELEALGLPSELLDQLKEEFSQDPGARILALTAMALKGVLYDLPRLRDLVTEVGTLEQLPRVAALKARLELHLNSLPTLDHEAIVGWRRGTAALAREVAAMKQVLQATTALHGYTVRKNFNFFTRPAQIGQWFDALARDPPNAPLAQNILQWVAAQPP